MIAKSSAVKLLKITGRSPIEEQSQHCLHPMAVKALYCQLLGGWDKPVKWLRPVAAKSPRGLQSLIEMQSIAALIKLTAFSLDYLAMFTHTEGDPQKCLPGAFAVHLHVRPCNAHLTTQLVRYYKDACNGLDVASYIYHIKSFAFGASLEPGALFICVHPR